MVWGDQHWSEEGQQNLRLGEGGELGGEDGAREAVAPHTVDDVSFACLLSVFWFI